MQRKVNSDLSKMAVDDCCLSLRKGLVMGFRCSAKTLLTYCAPIDSVQFIDKMIHKWEQCLLFDPTV